MKLRIRSLESKETLKIDLPNPSSLHQLKQTIADKISANPQTLHISLNRKDQLLHNHNHEDSLQSLGITSGDLIFYTLNPSAFSPLPPNDQTTLTTLPPSSSNPQTTPPVQTEQPETLEPPIRAEQTQTLTKEKQTMDETLADAPPMDMDMDMEMEMEMEVEISSPFPCILTKVYKDKQNEGSNLLMVAVHAVLLESGFVVFDSVLEKSIYGFRLPSNGQYTVPDLLTSSKQFETVHLKFENWGNYLNVYGSLSSSSSNICRLCLNKTRFVPSVSFACKDYDAKDSSIGFHVKQVFEFWKIVKDGLALPLLIDLCEVAGLALPPCFTLLPTELKLRILEFLPGVDVAKVGCVSSELRYLAMQESLWKQKAVEEFALSGEMEVDSWKKKFVSSLLLKRSGTRRYGHVRRGVTVRDPNRFGFPSRRGSGPFGFPGVIRGDYDRIPGLGSNTGLRFPARINFTPHCNLGSGFDA